MAAPMKVNKQNGCPCKQSLYKKWLPLVNIDKSAIFICLNALVWIFEFGANWNYRYFVNKNAIYILLICLNISVWIFELQKFVLMGIFEFGANLKLFAFVQTAMYVVFLSSDLHPPFVARILHKQWHICINNDALDLSPHNWHKILHEQWRLFYF